MSEEDLLSDVVENGGRERGDCTGCLMIVCLHSHSPWPSVELVSTGYYSVFRVCELAGFVKACVSLLDLSGGIYFTVAKKA